MTASAQNGDNQKKNKSFLERLALIVGIIASIPSIIGLISGWSRNPVLLAILAIISPFFLVVLSGRHLRKGIVKEKRLNISFLGWSLVLILSCFAFGAVVSWVLANQLLGLSFAPASDHTTFNFEENLQGWELGKSPAGKLLGKSLETSTEEAYTGARSLKYRLDLELEDTITGIGRVYSPPRFRGGELVVAYVWLPDGAPTNIGVDFFHLSSPGQQNAKSSYSDDLESELTLEPGKWNVLLWEIPTANYNLDISIGLKFRLIPRDRMKWDRYSKYEWEGDIYIDSIQVIKPPEDRPPIAIAVPTETPTPGPTEIPPTNTPSPTETSTPIPPTATDAPTSTPTPTLTMSKTIGTVIPGSLNVRVGPDVSYETKGVLYQDDTVTILGKASNGWLYILAESGLEGWGNGDYIDIDADLSEVPIVAAPTSTPPPTPASAPTLIDPEDGFVSVGTRPDLIWNWDGDIIQDYYFEVTIWLEDQQDPIDVAWVQYPCYKYDQVPEGKEGQTWEFWWHVAVVKGKPGEKKQWSPVEPCSKWPTVSVWDPGLVTETTPISMISDRRLVKVVVEPPTTPGVPPGGDDKKDDEKDDESCPPGDRSC